MKKKILILFTAFNIIALTSCDKSIVEPTEFLKLSEEQTLTTGKVEIYNRINIPGGILLYIDGNYITKLTRFYPNSNYFDCGYSSDITAVYINEKMEVGSHNYQIRNINGGVLINNTFYISLATCSPVNLFY
jgi:hypothetical protein